MMIRSHKIPFYPQQKKFSCGPASLRMVIVSLIENDVGEDILIELSGAKEKIGAHLRTFEENLPTLLAKISLLQGIPNKFEFILKENCTISELPDLSDQGFFIMLNHQTPDDRPHWTVFKKIDDESITVMDPEYGPDYQYPLHQFNWKGGWDENPTNQAIIAIRYSL